MVLRIAGKCSHYIKVSWMVLRIAGKCSHYIKVSWMVLRILGKENSLNISLLENGMAEM